MSGFAVMYDACVLYPAPLRDLLMRLALTDLYRAKWTNEIHDEWINNLLENRYDIEAQHPDHFLNNLLDQSPEGVLPAIKSHRLSLKNPPKSVGEYLQTLKNQSLTAFVMNLEKIKDFL